MRTFLGMKIKPIANGFILAVSFETTNNDNPADPLTDYDDIELYCKNVAAVKKALVQALAPVEA